jgi:hypothetical protein
MLAMYAADPGATGNDDTSWFHALSDGNTGQPSSEPFWTIEAPPPGGGGVGYRQMNVSHLTAPAAFAR